MIDQYGRSINYLRVSITERCTLRCAYCRAAEGDCPKQAELAVEDFSRIAAVMASLGVSKIRVTGGEPLLRRDVAAIIRALRQTPGIAEVTLTSNAQQLPGIAAALKSSGLTRLNISIDSLNEDKYRHLTGGGSLSSVLAGIDEAIAAGLLPLKLNAVLMRGVNDDEIDDFIALTKSRPLDMRFIELMPMGDGTHTHKRVPNDEILAARPYLTPLPPRYPGQPSSDYGIAGHMGRIGLISPISHRFCGNCNRVRVMSDGMLRPCLGANSEVSLLPALQARGDALLRETIYNAIYHKPAEHAFADAGFSPTKTMSRIGG
ncbi:MAG: GTP 3',8-cyclase MoaA [Clostridiales bacterium]|jgi:cyclic pyranopterin phosphate synthase|nr:GTP 3',8-cyclase MoaA [Clostridiales bacterium]